MKTNRLKTHLFSPHTDQCIYCGKSAQDDAIENTPCESSQRRKGNNPILSLKSVAENAAAISDQVHNNPNDYRKLYENLAGQLGGFPGIWAFIADCAIELERQHPQPWEDGWIETCQSIGALILKMDNLITPGQLVAMALSSTHKPNST